MCVGVHQPTPTQFYYANPVLISQPNPNPTTTIFVLVARWVEDINNGNNKINNGNNEKQWM